MADEHDEADDAPPANPKTPSELKRAREDAKLAREDRDQARRDLTAARSELTRTKTALEAEIEGLKTSHAADIEKVKIDLTGRATAAETAGKAATEAAQQRVMMSDLRAAAKDAGMVDMDGLKLLDMATAKMDADGNLTNADDMLAAMKEAKPYFFGAALPPGTKTGTTSSVASPPRQNAPKPFDARTATKEEYATQRASLVGGKSGNGNGANYHTASKTNFSVVNN